MLESTDQDVAKGTERVHAQLAPLVGEKSVFQPLVDHGVDFLQPVRRSEPDVSSSEEDGQMDSWLNGWMGEDTDD